MPTSTMMGTTVATTVGIIANPASARDIRRLVAQGGALTTHEKLNRLSRALTGLASFGVERVLSMADRGGIMAGLLQRAERESSRHWPALHFVDQPITMSDRDTRVATEVMVESGAGAILVLGGDGTNRVVATESADVPLVSLSTGTNNAFPQPVEPTVAGIAAALVATHPDCRRAGTYRAKRLEVNWRDHREIALVDVAVSHADGVGAGAVWDAELISELFLTFAEPDAIGLSAIGGHIRPVARRAPDGLAIALGQPATAVIHPPIGPGLVAPVNVRSVTMLETDVPVETRTEAGVIALDGERLFRFSPGLRPTITLRADGPVVVDLAATLGYAATNGLLAKATSSATPTSPATPPSPADQTRPDRPASQPTPEPRGNHCDSTESARPLHRDGPHSTIRVADPAGVPR